MDAITRRWADWGHSVTLFTSRAPRQPAEEDVCGVRVVRAGGRLSVYREARSFYRSKAPRGLDVVLDVVNTRPFLSPDFVIGVPVVALIFQVAREVWDYEVPWGAASVGRRWLEPRWLRRYRDIPALTISASSRDSLREYGLQDVTIVPVGFELPRTGWGAPPRETLPTVAFLGRLAANKRPGHALAAFERARLSVPDAQMWFIGGGPMERSLRRGAAEKPVHFFGRVDEATKRNLLARAHVLLVTSVREGWGLVVTEAASAGTPSIGYDVPGLRDSLRASNGVAVRPSIPDLAGAVAELLPLWAAQGPPAVAPGGVAPWTDVAASILDHLRAR